MARKVDSEGTPKRAATGAGRRHRAQGPVRAVAGRATRGPRSLLRRLLIEPVWDLEADDADLRDDLNRAIDQVGTTLAAQLCLPANAMATVAISSDAAVQALNRAWRGHDKPTNVLSFPCPAPAGSGQPGPILLGDVVLAMPTVRREAVELGIPLGHHLRHLVLHGLLHLLGYDHESESEAFEMEALETRALAAIGIPDPYLERPDEAARPTLPSRHRASDA